MARIGDHAPLARVFAGAFRFDVAAAVAVGEVGQHFELLVVFLMFVFERHILAAAFELIPRPRGLERVLRVLRAAQPARHAGFGVVVMEIGQQFVAIGERITRFQHEIVDVGVVVVVAVALAVQAGIEQLGAEAVVCGAAHGGAGQGLQAAVAGALGLYAGGAAKRFGNVAGNEVDHAADVLRPVAHRTAAAHHVHRLQVTDR